jgi:hypothetical protein
VEGWRSSGYGGHEEIRIPSMAGVLFRENRLRQVVVVSWSQHQTRLSQYGNTRFMFVFAPCALAGLHPSPPFPPPSTRITLFSRVSLSELPCSTVRIYYIGVNLSKCSPTDVTTLSTNFSSHPTFIYTSNKMTSSISHTVVQTHTTEASEPPSAMAHSRNLSTISSATLLTNTTLHSQPYEPLLRPHSPTSAEYHDVVSHPSKESDRNLALPRWSQHNTLPHQDSVLREKGYTERKPLKSPTRIQMRRWGKRILQTIMCESKFCFCQSKVFVNCAIS